MFYSAKGSTEMEPHAAEEANHHLSFNIKIFAALLGFTAITIALNFIPLGSLKLSAGVQILLALIKSSIAAGFVTFLLHRNSLLVNLLIFTAVNVLGLVLITLWGWSEPIPGTVHTAW